MQKITQKMLIDKAVSLLDNGTVTNESKKIMLYVKRLSMELSR